MSEHSDNSELLDRWRTLSLIIVWVSEHVAGLKGGQARRSPPAAAWRPVGFVIARPYC